MRKCELARGLATLPLSACADAASEATDETAEQPVTAAQTVIVTVIAAAASRERHPGPSLSLRSNMGNNQQHGNLV